MPLNIKSVPTVLKSILSLSFSLLLFAHASSAQLTNLPGDNFFLKGSNSINSRFDALNVNVEAKTRKFLMRLVREEKRLAKRASRKDTTIGNQLQVQADELLNLLQRQEEKTFYEIEYLGHLDTLKQVFKFLKMENFDAGNIDRVGAITESISGLETKLSDAIAWRNLFDIRRQLLSKELEKVGLANELRRYKSKLQHYNAQIEDYKQILSDGSKIESLLIGEISKLPAFKKFFSQNSELSRLFSLPSTNDYVSSLSTLSGLQTRSEIDQIFLDRFGMLSTQMIGSVRNNAGIELQSLLNTVASFKEGNYGDSDLENGRTTFKKHNSQNLKSFAQRIELSYDFQSQRSRDYFPTTTDIGIGLGYKLSDRSTMGLGASYKLGLGYGWDDINISHQGVSLRSFFDMKFKHSLFMYGGFELNQYAMIQSMDMLKNQDSWTKSGLIGLGKQISLKGKVKGDFKLLWDFLSYYQVPKRPSFLWRIGYKIK